MAAPGFIYWQDGEMWLGYLDQYPDYMTQGTSLQNLKEHLLDLTMICLRASSQTCVSILNSSWREAARIDQENRRAGCNLHSTRRQTRLVSEPDDEDLPAGPTTHRDKRESRAQYSKKAGEIVSL